MYPLSYYIIYARVYAYFLVGVYCDIDDIGSYCNNIIHIFIPILI